MSEADERGDAESGVLKPRDRYRVLADLLDYYQDLAEMADRKSRFALVILGAVNALNLIIIARPVIAAVDPAARPAYLGLYIGVYLALSLYLFVQAISALKPRIATVLYNVATPHGASRSIMGARFVHNILDSSFEQYYDKWLAADYGDVNRDLALHVRQLAEIVKGKYTTLRRLYVGLEVLVFLTAGLVALLTVERIAR